MTTFDFADVRRLTVAPYSKDDHRVCVDVTLWRGCTRAYGEQCDDESATETVARVLAEARRLAHAPVATNA